MTQKKSVFNADVENFSTGENFAELFNQMYSTGSKLEGYVTKGTIVDIKKDFVIVNVGLKSEGAIDIKEFRNDQIKVGDIVDVFVERYEGHDGTLIASREKARKEEVWKEIEQLVADNKVVEGKIVERVRGGFTVDLNGVPAFMPSSQLDINPIKDLNSIMNKPMEFKIIKMDKLRSNLIVSHRAILEGDRAEKRDEIIKNIKIGDVMEGVIKNITDYGVFIDLGGVDGLLHITDISWKRVSNPSEIFTIGQKINVKVINFDPETSRVSLGMKQLENDPWQNIEKFEVGKIYKGIVTNLTDYGAFIDLEDGIEGLVHVSEISWTKKNLQPSKVLSVSSEVDVMVLEIDREKRRISLGLKQCTPNPWKEFEETHSVNDIIEGEIKNITEFGIFVSLGNDLDGMVHLSDIDWDKNPEEAVKDYQKGMVIKTKILEIDADKERISLGIKQLKEDRVASSLDKVKKGEVVTCVVKEIREDGIVVDVNGVPGFIKTFDLSKTKSEQKPERFAVDEKVDAKITNVDMKTRQITLSIKAYEIDEEKKIMKEYGSTDTGALLGDILGASIEEKEKKSKK
ncbi:30S ribosomal protein S1 [bacterium]|nr:30S ribosomal protein S1 [bacterium]